MNQLCIRDLAEIVGGRLRLGCLPPLGGEFEPLGGVAFDSRQVKRGEVYWGLGETGTNDCGCHPDEAFAGGALGAVVAGRRLEPWAGKFSLEVADTRAALWQLARAMRLRFTGTVIAVTGSGLETEARDAIGAVLRCREERSALALETNDEPRLAKSLIELDERAKVALVELSTGTGRDLRKLARACCPHVAVLVGRGNEYGGMGTPAATAEAQAEVLASLPDDGIALVDGDDAGLRRVAKHTGAQVIWFGGGPHCDVYASDLEWRGGGLSLVVDGQPLRLPACGRSHLPAVLAAYAVGRVFEISPRRIAAALARFRPAVREVVTEPSEECLLTT